MNSQKNARIPVSSQFLRAIAAPTKLEEDKPIPMDMDFPTLDELEMDVPILNEHMSQMRNHPEDDSDWDMQCLKHVSPSLGLRSLEL
jgi:hypothetical protein